jgi:hypothetical protein
MTEMHAGQQGPKAQCGYRYAPYGRSSMFLPNERCLSPGAGAGASPSDRPRNDKTPLPGRETAFCLIATRKEE